MLQANKTVAGLFVGPIITYLRPSGLFYIESSVSKRTDERRMSESIASPALLAVPAPRVGINPWFIAITVTLATFMELLDTAIANVALPHIAGGLAVSYDESTWVLTSYL